MLYIWIYASTREICCLFVLISHELFSDFLFYILFQIKIGRGDMCKSSPLSDKPHWFYKRKVLLHRMGVDNQNRESTKPCLYGFYVLGNMYILLS